MNFLDSLDDMKDIYKAIDNKNIHDNGPVETHDGDVSYKFVIPDGRTVCMYFMHTIMIAHLDFEVFRPVGLWWRTKKVHKKLLAAGYSDVPELNPDNRKRRNRKK